MYAEVNQWLGDIVKVTPTSKAVGDLALFLVANQLSIEALQQSDKELSFPASVIDLVGGMMGQPPGGFPPEVIRKAMRDRPPVLERPGKSLQPADFDAVAEKLKLKLQRTPTSQEVVTSVLYPKVFDEFLDSAIEYGNLSLLPTPAFFYGPKPGEEISVDIEAGKRLIVKFAAVGQPRPDGTRTVFFELNGQPREVEVIDRSLEATVAAAVKADPADPTHIAASMPGMVIGIAVQAGDRVAKGQKLLALEAMKMETVVYADREGTIEKLLVRSGSQVETNDLLLVLK